jgi:hypothetical protein
MKEKTLRHCGPYEYLDMDRLEAPMEGVAPAARSRIIRPKAPDRLCSHREHCQVVHSSVRNQIDANTLFGDSARDKGV